MTNLTLKEVLMKKLLFFFMVTLLLSVGYVFPQSLGYDYVSEVKGDTLVIKDYIDMDNEPNSLYYALLLDTIDVPAGRVYELKTNGYYPLLLRPTTRINTIIVGQDGRSLVHNDDTGSAPPLICGYEVNRECIQAEHDLTIKNCQLANISYESMGGIFFTNTNASNLHLVYDNCLFENTTHWFVYIRDDSNQTVIFRDCYFVNMNGQPCRRDGGVYISFNKQDTLLVENCTHIMAQGHVYKFMTYEDTYQYKSIIFNHNTFVNCAGSVFLNPGYQSNMNLTNNIFVNCNVQPYMKGLDYIETDPDSLPMGIVNVRDFPDSAEQVERRILVDKNAVFWSDALSDVVSQVSSAEINGTSEWYNQMIKMNARTQNMFDDDATYPYLTEGVWYEKLPNFVDPQDLFTTQLANLKAFAIATVELTSEAVLPDWRLINTDSSVQIYPDWPIPIDLSYDDANLLDGGTDGFPVGDLNWFPTKKAEWEALNTSIHGSTKNLPMCAQLWQNYPNPFNPSTSISFSIPKAAHVTLKVYNIQGREVTTLLDGFKAPQTYKLKFDGTGLASGTYIARLTAGNFNKSIKLVLLK
jgi:hypothetical protein